MVRGKEWPLMAGVVLTSREEEFIRRVLARYPAVSGALVFGSRAKGTATPSSDVDLALEGDLGPLEAQAIAAELEELPLPYRFDVKALADIRHVPLREHISLVGVRVYG
jgi:uncharacterized protein